MTSVLSGLQADYERRAQQAAQVPVSPATVPVRPRHTKTYTGQALARRQAWGRLMGGAARAAIQDFRREAENNE